MPIELTTRAIEESTIYLAATFTDQDGDATNVKAGANYEVTDQYGNNIRTGTPTTIEVNQLDIVLSGDDLAVAGYPGPTKIIVTVTATYDTLINGVSFTDLPVKEQAEILIDHLPAVP